MNLVGDADHVLQADTRSPYLAYVASKEEDLQTDQLTEGIERARGILRLAALAVIVALLLGPMLEASARVRGQLYGDVGACSIEGRLNTIADSGGNYAWAWTDSALFCLEVQVKMKWKHNGTTYLRSDSATGTFSTAEVNTGQGSLWYDYLYYSWHWAMEQVTYASDFWFLTCNCSNA